MIERQVQEWREIYGAADASAAWLLCDRHDPEAVAYLFLGADLVTEQVTFGELAGESRRLASVLHARGVGRGDRVAVLLSKRRELPVTLLALWRLGAVHVPLFTAFAQGAIASRVRSSGARLLVSEPGQLEKAAGLEALDVLDVADLTSAADTAAPFEESIAVGGDGTLVEIFTSGTTGDPKGVPVPLRMLAGVESYVHYGLDVREDDVFWNAADPGWAYGLYVGLLASLCTGRRGVVCTTGFTPTLTIQVIRTLGVTNFAGAPTIYRALRTTGLEEPLALRCASSAGEPLNADLVEYGRQWLGTEIRDHYGQTELGMVLGNHWHPEVARPIVAGSMGQPLPGFALSIVEGQVAVDTESPLMWFTGYMGGPEVSAQRFTADRRWYLTSDLGRRDEDGNFYFGSRNDDVILAAGYRIGPGDVESVLAGFPGVAEVAVVGRPDPEGIRGEQVEAFVVLMPDTEASDELADELAARVRETYSKHAYPRRVHFVAELPKTPSGKIQRFALRDPAATPRGSRP